MSSPEDRSLDAFDAPDPSKAAKRFLPERPSIRVAPPPAPAAQLVEKAEVYDLFGADDATEAEGIEDDSIVPIGRRSAEPELTEEYTLEAPAANDRRPWVAAAAFFALIAAVGLAMFALSPGPAISESPAAEPAPTAKAPISAPKVAPKATVPSAEMAPTAAPVPIVVAAPAAPPPRANKRSVRPAIAGPAPVVEAPVVEPPAPAAAPEPVNDDPWAQKTAPGREAGTVWDAPK